MDLPPGMKNGLLVAMGPDGKLRIEMAADGENKGGFTTEPDKAGFLAAQILECARIAHEKSPHSVLQDGTQKESQWPTLQATKVALGPCHMPGHESLIVQFGQAVLGIALPSEALRSLGEALIALSADPGKPQ
ncbi:MAG: hypothetical protein GY862_34480 [Gammaproteobacteria bacterium]|nr:hypothetical protein [Gammaproteobacteria bacterium]